MKCTRQRCQVALSALATVALMPSWASGSNQAAHGALSSQQRSRTWPHADPSVMIARWVGHSGVHPAKHACPTGLQPSGRDASEVLSD
jgi:hypothetical protein